MACTPVVRLFTQYTYSVLENKTLNLSCRYELWTATVLTPLEGFEAQGGKVTSPRS